VLVGLYSSRALGLCTSRALGRYMPDLLRATTDLMLAPDDCLTQRTYNVRPHPHTPPPWLTHIASHRTPAARARARCLHPPVGAH
jgi:hypothetical protein